MGSYPWRLKLVHEGGRTIRVERDGVFFCFDPSGEFGGVTLLTGADEERTAGVRATAAHGIRPKLAATDDIADAVGDLGPSELTALPAEIDGVSVRGMAYEPIDLGGEGAVVRLKRVIRGPRKALQRAAARTSEELSPACVIELTLPDGARLVHLDLSLHGEIDPAWVAEAQEQFAGAEWLLFGCEYGQDEGLLKHLKGFGAKRYIFADLVNDSRKSRGLPTNIMTPTADRLVEQGLEIHLMPPHVGLRFEGK